MVALSLRQQTHKENPMVSHFWKHITLMAMSVFVTVSVGSPSIAAEKIKIGLLKTSLNGPMFIAIEKGYFAAEGLDADLVFFDSAQPVAVAIVSGDLQFGAAALTAGLYTLGGQDAVRIIASEGFEAPGFSSLAIVVSNRAYDAGLTSFKALPGHSVAVTQIGSGSHYSLALIAEKYGLELKSIRILPLQSFPNAASAVIGGQADAGDIAVNYVAPAIDHHDLKLLGYDGDESP
jgi:NitT/TauT family transport system substrate-binding protein